MFVISTIRVVQFPLSGASQGSIGENLRGQSDVNENQRAKKTKENKLVEAYPKSLNVGGVNLPRVSTEAAEYIKDEMLELTREALDDQGLFAFACPIESAAHHEAGHSIIYRLLGEEISHCEIKEEYSPHGPVWLGLSEYKGAGDWEINEKRDPLHDLDQAAIQGSGLIAEMMFDDVFHKGSSLSELVVGSALKGGQS